MSTSLNRHQAVNLHDSARYFVAGNFAGIVGVVVGQPFDTIKVRLQTQHGLPGPVAECAGSGSGSGLGSRGFVLSSHLSTSRFAGPLQCVAHTVKQDGIRGLYRGMASPVLAVGLQKSIAFGVYATVAQHLKADKQRNTLLEIMFAGIAGGIANSVILTPVDQIKVAMQVQKYDGHQPSVTVILRRIVTEQGITKGLYGNLVSTNLREIPMYTIYYSLYTGLSRIMQEQQPQHTHGVSEASLSIGDKLLIGGLTGTGTWAAFFPLDTLKSAMMAQTARNLPPEYRMSITQMTQHIYQSGGVRAFYQGYQPALLRAFPVHAMVLTTYDLLLKLVL